MHPVIHQAIASESRSENRSSLGDHIHSLTQDLASDPVLAEAFHPGKEGCGSSRPGGLVVQVLIIDDLNFAGIVFKITSINHCLSSDRRLYPGG